MTSEKIVEFLEQIDNQITELDKSVSEYNESSSYYEKRKLEAKKIITSVILNVLNGSVDKYLKKLEPIIEKICDINNSSYLEYTVKFDDEEEIVCFYKNGDISFSPSKTEVNLLCIDYIKEKDKWNLNKQSSYDFLYKLVRNEKYLDILEDFVSYLNEQMNNYKKDIGFKVAFIEEDIARFCEPHLFWENKE